MVDMMMMTMIMRRRRRKRILMALFYCFSSTLPDTLLTCNQYTPFISYYRQLVGDILFQERSDPQNAGKNNIEITSWKALVYWIFVRVGDVLEIKRLRFLI